MGGKSSNLELERVADVLRSMRGRIASVSTIANRLGRGVSMVQRAVDQMAAAGAIEIVLTFKGDQCRLRDGAQVSGSVSPYEAVGEECGDADDEFDDEDIPDGLNAEAFRAAAMWRERMGERRWQDDPRALRERMQNLSIIPPFYNQLQREA